MAGTAQPANSIGIADARRNRFNNCGSFRSNFARIKVSNAGFGKATTGTEREIRARSAWVSPPEPVAQDTKEMWRSQSKGAVQAQQSWRAAWGRQIGEGATRL